MGGMACMLYGHLDEATIIERAATPSLIGRLLGRGPSGLQFSPDKERRELMEVDARDLEREVFGALREHVICQCEPAWPATREALSYLDLEVFKLYLRKEQFDPQLRGRWFAQLTFSGCAGQAEVSAELWSHWAHLFAQREATALGQVLSRKHFQLDVQQPELAQSPVFLPAGELGYALVSPVPSNQSLTEGMEPLELDAAILEERGEAEATASAAALVETYADEIARRACCCQLCSAAAVPRPADAQGR